MVLQPKMESSPITCTPVKNESAWVNQLSEQVDHQHMVLVHLNIYGPMPYRVWPTTYLFDQHSDHRSQLLHIENMAIHPTYAYVDIGQRKHRRLNLEGLPKSCTVFDFREVIPESGPFEQKGIPHNTSEIYTLELR